MRCEWQMSAAEELLQTEDTKRAMRATCGAGIHIPRRPSAAV